MRRTCTCREQHATVAYLLLAEGSDHLHSGSDTGRALLSSLETSDLMHAGRSGESSGEDGSGGGSGCGGGRDGLLVGTGTGSTGQSCRL